MPSTSAAQKSGLRRRPTSTPSSRVYQVRHLLDRISDEWVALILAALGGDESPHSMRYTGTVRAASPE